MGDVWSQLPTVRRWLHFGPLPLLVVIAVRVRGFGLIEEHLPHDPSRKRNEIGRLHGLNGRTPWGPPRTADRPVITRVRTGTLVGAESPAGRVGEAARRTAPLVEHGARHVGDWRLCRVAALVGLTFVLGTVARTPAHGESALAPESFCRSVDRCAR